MTQELVMEAVKNMPHEFEINELVDRLSFMEKVSKGIKQAEDGQKLSYEEVKQIARGWQK